MIERPQIPHGELPDLVETNIEDAKEHPMLKTYPVEYIGHGGQNIVFRFLAEKNSPDAGEGVVVKAQVDHILDGMLTGISSSDSVQKFNESMSGSEDKTVNAKGVKGVEKQTSDIDKGNLIDTNKKTEDKLEDELIQEREYFKKITDVFREGTVSVPASMVAKVPVGPNIAKALFTSEQAVQFGEEIKEVDTILRFQKILPDKARNEGLSFGFKYAENNYYTPDEYENINRMLLEEGVPLDKELVKRFLHKGTVELLEQAESDEELRNLITEFVEKAIEFTGKHNEMLDLAGRDNVVFFKDDNNNWMYLMVDVHHSALKWDDAQNTIANIDFKDDLSPIDTSQVFNGINYARMLNGMAKWLDIDGRVDVMSLREEASRDVSDVSDIVLLNIRRTFQDLPRVPRIPNKPITNQDVELRGDLPDTQVISTRAV